MLILRRLFLAVLLSLLSLPGMAAWTGIGAFFADGEANWVIDGQNYEAAIDYYGLRIEEKTAVDLRIGASGGQFSNKLLDLDGTRSTEKFQGEFLSFYLRWPHVFNEHWFVHSNLDYRFNFGRLAGDDETEIDWTELNIHAGIGLRSGRLVLRPFVEYRDVDGDITGPDPTRLFKLDEQTGSGLVIDYLVESNAFLRLSIRRGAQESLFFELAREF